MQIIYSDELKWEYANFNLNSDGILTRLKGEKVKDWVDFKHVNLTVGKKTAYIKGRPPIQHWIDENLMLCIADKRTSAKKNWWLVFPDFDHLKKWLTNADLIIKAYEAKRAALVVPSINDSTDPNEKTNDRSRERLKSDTDRDRNRDLTREIDNLQEISREQELNRNNKNRNRLMETINGSGTLRSKYRDLNTEFDQYRSKESETSRVNDEIVHIYQDESSKYNQNENTINASFYSQRDPAINDSWGRNSRFVPQTPPPLPVEEDEVNRMPKRVESMPSYGQSGSDDINRRYAGLPPPGLQLPPPPPPLQQQLQQHQQPYITHIKHENPQVTYIRHEKPQVTRVEYKSYDEFEEANRRYEEYEKKRYEYERKKGDVSRREPSVGRYKDEPYDQTDVKRSSRREPSQSIYKDLPLDDRSMDVQRTNGNTNINRKETSTSRYRDDPYQDNPSAEQPKKRPSNLKDTSFYDEKSMNRSMASSSSKTGSIRKKEIHFRDEVEVRS